VDCSLISHGSEQFLCSHDRRCINATRQYDKIADYQSMNDDDQEYCCRRIPL
ncbi:unnamed protein product, partial [Rotaria sp. Silwood1]